MLRSLFRKTKPTPVGRWTRTNAARKAELANHDHCGGPQCSKTELTKSYDNNIDFTLCALQSFHVNPSNVPYVDTKHKNTDSTRH